jgi:hypothetical protein
MRTTPLRASLTRSNVHHSKFRGQCECFDLPSESDPEFQDYVTVFREGLRSKAQIFFIPNERSPPEDGDFHMFPRGVGINVMAENNTATRAARSYFSFLSPVRGQHGPTPFRRSTKPRNATKPSKNCVVPLATLAREIVLC